MANLIASSEFGDWLMADISKSTQQSKSLDPMEAGTALKRLKSLKTAKAVLLEFLTLQQKMMAKARANSP